MFKSWFGDVSGRIKTATNMTLLFPAVFFKAGSPRSTLIHCYVGLSANEMPPQFQWSIIIITYDHHWNCCVYFLSCGVNPPNIFSDTAITCHPPGVWDYSCIVVLTYDHWVLYHLCPGGQHAHRPLQCLEGPQRLARAVSGALVAKLAALRQKVPGRCATKVEVSQTSMDKALARGWSKTSGWCLQLWLEIWINLELPSLNITPVLENSQPIFSFRGSNRNECLNEFQQWSN